MHPLHNGNLFIYILHKCLLFLSVKSMHIFPMVLSCSMININSLFTVNHSLCEYYLIRISKHFSST